MDRLIDKVVGLCELALGFPEGSRGHVLCTELVHEAMAELDVSIERLAADVVNGLSPSQTLNMYQLFKAHSSQLSS